MPRTILSKVPVLGFPEPPYKLGNPELSLGLHLESPRALVYENVHTEGPHQEPCG